MSALSLGYARDGEGKRHCCWRHITMHGEAEASLKGGSRAGKWPVKVAGMACAMT
jgi:hypothetical protein